MKNNSPKKIKPEPPKEIERKTSKANLELKFQKKNMIVAVRSRPINQQELEMSNIKVVTVPEKDLITVKYPLEYSYVAESKMYLNDQKEISITKSKEHNFKFDFAFDENSKQETVYHYTTEPLISSIVEGFNATVMAYGATGSGKTYSMIGTGENPGLMVRSLSDLFTAIEKEKNKNYIVSIGYIEVYNEILKDLLFESEDNSQPPKLCIRHDNQKGTVIVGASTKKVSNANDAFKLLVRGNKRRTERPTVRNENSSRSHAILEVHIQIKESEDNNQITFGKFLLVDLAGSEKISGTKTEQSRESGNINKSLLALSKCISSLLKQNQKYIPWRESKLTQILEDSLSGNSQIVMIATISPSVTCVDETMNTLNYADNAKKLKVNVKKQIIEENTFKVAKYDETIKQLKQEIASLRAELADKEKGSMTPVQGPPKIQTDQSEDGAQTTLINHFQEEIKITKKIIEKERECEEIKKKLYSLDDINSTEGQNLKKQIEGKQNELASSYTVQYNLMGRRKEMQKLIMRMVNLPQGRILVNIYRYYIAYLENMLSEHRRYVNSNEINRKDKAIIKLSAQLDQRDRYIITAGEEIQKAQGKVTYRNKNFITADEIELNPYKLPTISVYPNENSRIISPNKLASPERQRIKSETIEVNKNNFEEDESKVRSPSPQQNIVTNFRQYNEELKPLIHDDPLHQSGYLSRFKRLRLYRNGSRPVLSRQFGGIDYTTRGYSSKRRSNYNYNYNMHASGNISNEKGNTSDIQETNTSRLETEIQKKVKTILSRDIIGRYKRSPYIKNNH